MRMKLMTKAIKAKFERVGTQEGATDPLAILKLFDPCGRWTYYATEYNAEDRVLWGYCVSALEPDYDEWGHSDLGEIEATRNRFGLHMERDLWFRPMPISEILGPEDRGYRPEWAFKNLQQPQAQAQVEG